LITQDDVDEALAFLGNADEQAEDRSTRSYMDAYQKSLKALLMKEHDHGNSVAQQERDAYADPVYIKHLEAQKEATFRDEKSRFLREKAHATISCWQTQCANERGAR
jgi:hypothetical protein